MRSHPSSTSLRGRLVLVACALLAATILVAPASAQEVIGEHVYESLGTGSSYPVLTERPLKSEEPQLVWSEVIVYPGATYIAPHFSRLNLPPGDVLVVRSVDAEQFWTYTAQGRDDLGVSEEGLFATHLKGDTAIFELYSANDRRSLKAASDGLPWGFEVDFYGRGYAQPEIDAYWRAGLGEEMNLPRPEWLNTKAICGTDDSREAKCYQSSEPAAYDRARAVARLFKNGNVHCTGWLFGSEGHIMTNEHCIGSQSELNTIDFEFMAEGGSCFTNCQTAGACSGTIEASGGILEAVDAGLDYALVDPSGSDNLSDTYGYLRMRASGALVGERLYIPQHPAGWGKRIAVESTHSADGGYAKVQSLTAPACSGSGNDVGYYADTRGGSSGSPVLGHNDDLVIALHHCANCQNRGVPVDDILADLGSNAPANATGSCTNMVPFMTSATSPSGTVTSSGELSASYPAWKAFDSSNSLWLSELYESPAWIAYQFPAPRYIDRYSITFANGSLTSRAPKNWTFQGWTGFSWVTLDTRTDQTGWTSGTRSYTVTSPGYYSKYRLRVTEDNDSRSAIVTVSIGRLALETCGCASSTNQVPTMTSATTPSGTVTSSGELSSSYPAWKVFDASNSLWLSELYEAPAWVAYEFTSERFIDHYSITFANGSLTSRAPKNWTLQGWNGSSWETVDTRTNETGWSSGTRSYTVATPDYYEKYRLRVTEDNDSRSAIVTVSIGRLTLDGCS